MGKGPNWTEEELDLLRSLYPVLGPTKLAESGRLPGRSAKALKLVAGKLGISFRFKAGRMPRWTEEEELILRRLFPVEGAPGVHKRLPHRSRRAINHRARLLKLPKPPAKNHARGAWREDEIQILSELYTKVGPTGLVKSGKLPGRSYGAIRAQAAKLGLRFERRPVDVFDEGRDEGRILHKRSVDRAVVERVRENPMMAPLMMPAPGRAKITRKGRADD